MTISLPRARQSVYQLSDGLRDESVLLGVRAAAPNEAEREELLLAKLGPKGWGRLHHFRHYYSAGWGDGSGRPLSPRALETFYRFLEVVKFPNAIQPSVFLTDEGWIELCWSDRSGKAVQVEFRSIEVEFYVEAEELEGAIRTADVTDLARRLSA
jgi:hypothetical protein